MSQIEETANAEFRLGTSSWISESLVSNDKKVIPQAVAFIVHVFSICQVPMTKDHVNTAFRVWSKSNKDAINALADYNGGRNRLDLGVMSIIETSHCAKVIASKPRNNTSTMPYNEAVQKVKQSGIVPGHTEEKQSGFKRPRPRNSPDTVMVECKQPHTVAPPKRQTPPLRAVVTIREQAFASGIFEALTPCGIRYTTVLDGIHKRRIFLAGFSVVGGVGKRYADTTVSLNLPNTHTILGIGKTFDNDLFVRELRSATNTMRDEDKIRRHGVHGLRLLAAGTYNFVASAVDSDKLHPLLQGQNFVLRLPRPKALGIPVDEACMELHSMMVAAHGGYGPKVLWAYVSVVETEPQDRCHLFSALERGSESLHACIFDTTFDAPNTMQIFCDTVFDISVRNIVSLDAKLDNFLSRKQADGRVTDVLAIDFDSQLYRHMSSKTDPRVALTFNLLYVGANLRTYGTLKAWEAWCNHPMGKGNMLTFVSSLVSGLRGSEHPLSSAVWCMESLTKWKPRSKPGDSYIDTDAIAVVFHYFVRTSFIEGLGVASKIRSGSREGVSHFQGMLGPSMRFFVERLHLRHRLLQVMLDFWTTKLVPFPPGNRTDSAAILCGDTVRPFVQEVLDQVEKT